MRAIAQSGCAAKMPPFLDVLATAVAVRALPRVFAQLSTSAKGCGSLARHGVGIARAASSDGWAASECEVAGPWPSQGSDGGVLLRQAGLGSPRSSHGLTAQIFERQKNAGRAVERTPGWLEGGFADSPKT